MGNQQTKDVELFESIDLCEAKIDKERAVVSNVKVLGLTSRKPRDYSEAALRKAVGLYEGVRVNIDHGKFPGRDGETSDRSYRDRFGFLKDVRFVPGDGLRGDLHFNPKHALAEQFAWDVEHAPENVGFSHRAFGHGRQVGDRYLVEKISAVRSVDLVADPATTKSLFESFQPERKEPEMKKTIKEILEAHKTNFRASQLLSLIEEDMGALPVDMPADVPVADVPAEDQIWLAFKSAVNAVLDDDKMDIPSSIKRITEILKSYEKLESTAPGNGPSDSSSDALASESIQNELAALRAKTTKLEGEQAAYRLLQESKLPANPTWVEAIAALPAERRKAFVESLPRTATDSPRSASPFVESAKGGDGASVEFPKTLDEFASRLTR